MKTTFLTSSVSRIAGGVLGSLLPLSKAVLSMGVDVSVLALHDASTADDMDLWAPVHPMTFNVKGPSAFGYAPALKRQLIREAPDIVHTHGIWMYPSLAVNYWHTQTNKPYIISPHNMLDPSALAISRWKKALANAFYENQHLNKAACIHSLCSSETQAIRQYGLKNPICQIPNGIDMPEVMSQVLPPWVGKVESGKKVLLYLGRIYPKKGLSNLLKGWAKYISINKNCGWVLVIAGWDQLGHEKELKHLSNELSIDDTIVFLGPQFNEFKDSAYYHADAFILPSYFEGMPMVILEAWAHNLPVLMTDFCNLPEGFVAEAALRIAPEPVSICNGLDTLFDMTDHERTTMGERGKALVREQFTWQKAAFAMKSVYEWVLCGGIPPNCVRLD